MRQLIADAFPDHGIFGEEHGLKAGTGDGADYVWVLDPIDGTKSFITGKHEVAAVVAIRWTLRSS